MENIWVAVAAQLEKYCDAGLEQPLTGDVVRFATIAQLAAAWAEPSRLEAGGGVAAYQRCRPRRVRAGIEFKHPREPRETHAAWTQHLGEALKDIHRLAHMPFVAMPALAGVA